jgi:hypothetical protein
MHSIGTAATSHVFLALVKPSPGQWELGREGTLAKGQIIIPVYNDMTTQLTAIYSLFTLL